MAYRLEVKRSAVKSLRRVPKDVQKRSIDAIDGLADDPYPAGSVKMVGYETLYRIRIGDWRIVYEVNEEQGLVTILAVAHRRDVYKTF